MHHLGISPTPHHLHAPPQPHLVRRCHARTHSTVCTKHLIVHLNSTGQHAVYCLSARWQRPHPLLFCGTAGTASRRHLVVSCPLTAVQHGRGDVLRSGTVVCDCELFVPLGVGWEGTRRRGAVNHFQTKVCHEVPAAGGRDDPSRLR